MPKWIKIVLLTWAWTLPLGIFVEGPFLNFPEWFYWVQGILGYYITEAIYNRITKSP